MVSKIRNQLLTGSITNIAVFGCAKLPGTPYLVIKEERDIIGRGLVYRIYCHVDPGQQIALKNYVVKELPTLLDGFEATTLEGNYKRLKMLDNDIEMIAISNDDETISMSRGFLSYSHIVF